MKASPNKKVILAILLGLLLATIAPGTGMAQRLSHPSFGGGNQGGGNRGGAPPPRPAPVSAPVQRPAPASARPVNPAPPRPQETRPTPAVVSDNRSINGGSRNYGNHDFHPVPNAPIHENPVMKQQAVVVDRSHPRAGSPNVYHTGGYRGMHPYYYHPFRPSYWGPNWHPFGYFLSSLAANAVLLSIAGQSYYYEDGCYYAPSNGGYTVVPPPVGAVVADLPQGYETTMVGNDTFYYFGGAFYIDNGQGFQVVTAPPGAVITQLPVGAVEQQINGETLMVYNNVYYLPISEDGQDAYEVVQGN